MHYTSKIVNLYSNAPSAQRPAPMRHALLLIFKANLPAITKSIHTHI